MTERSSTQINSGVVPSIFCRLVFACFDYQYAVNGGHSSLLVVGVDPRSVRRHQSTVVFSFILLGLCLVTQFRVIDFVLCWRYPLGAISVTTRHGSTVSVIARSILSWH